ncbi:MAG TPA: hypothetical protein EYP78_04810 [Candidatus Omnitrophica bacterium]|nr:hypothetical protein [Candidatus Omnitrophota bacterium]
MEMVQLGQFSRRYVELFGFQCVEVNSELDGDFPNRPSEPRPEYLGELSRKVVTEKADVGFAIT